MNKTNYITEGDLTQIIIKLSLPMVLAFLLQTSFNIIDGIFVGRISAEALAAVSMAFPVVMLMVSLGSGIGVGVASMVARNIGAKNYKKANNAAEHALIIAGILALFFTFTGLIFSKNLFVMLGASGNLLKLTIEYSNIIFLGSTFMFLAFTANHILRGEGDMKTPMIIMGGSAILNVILDPIFIFVLDMGVQGAAIATMISRFIACIYVFIHMYKEKSIIKLSFKYFKYKIEILKELFKIGFPQSISQLLFAISMFFMIKILAPYGSSAIAAYGAAFRIDGVAFMPIIGMMTAVITIVGQNIGAKKIKRANDTIKKASLIAIAYASIIGIMFFIFAIPLSKLFSKDLNVIYFASMYLVINAISYLFIGIAMIIQGYFLGTGKSMPPMIINVCRLVLIAVPLAYFLSKTYGVIGVWIGISLSSIISGILSVIWYNFQLNKDKKTKV